MAGRQDVRSALFEVFVTFHEEMVRLDATEDPRRALRYNRRIEGAIDSFLDEIGETLIGERR